MTEGDNADDRADDERPKPELMPSEMKAIFAMKQAKRLMDKPILCKLPSEPGWRALIGKFEADDSLTDQELVELPITARIEPVHFWGFDQTSLFLTKPAAASPRTALPLLDRLFTSFFGADMGATAAHTPFPVDADGKRMGPLVFGIADPTVSDDDIIAAWKMSADRANHQLEVERRVAARMANEDAARPAQTGATKTE